MIGNDGAETKICGTQEEDCSRDAEEIMKRQVLSSELADQATEQSDQTQGVSLCFNHEHNRKTLNYQKQLNILTNVITLS